jgi:hypothetical protein
MRCQERTRLRRQCSRMAVSGYYYTDARSGKQRYWGLCWQHRAEPAVLLFRRMQNGPDVLNANQWELRYS